MTKSQQPYSDSAQSPPRHCMIVHAHYPVGEPRVEREAKALVAHGYAVDVICLRGEDEISHETIDGIAIYRLPVHRDKRRGPLLQMVEYVMFLVLAALKSWQLHRRAPYRVVQTHNLPDFLIFAALPVKLSGGRAILDIHDLMPEFYAARFGVGLDSRPVRLVLWQERVSCRFADHVITVSEHWRQTLIRRGVPAEKCSVVMNVADDRIFQPSPVPEPLPHNPGGLHLIYHGRLVERYGLDLAVRAVAMVRDEMPGVRLTLLGVGEHADELNRLIDELGLRAHVELYNELRPLAELPPFVRAADLGVVPYHNDTFTDGLLPTKLMEYAALGMPAIASRTTAIESTFGGTMVALFEPGDVEGLAACLRALYRDPARLNELRDGSRRFNERYNWPKIGGAYVALVGRLGAGRRAAEQPLPV
ncbi:glycosyltransferase family 4 protein [Promineifilum sp.]|uniref:glycosyltransferase family 4 protein n=1 Tax=Promineifilum sp. TaxID=2664178 RepID=UPI0035B2F8A1